MARRALVALLVAALVPRGAARAQSEPEPNPRAETLNERGKALYSEQKDYAAAAEKFRQAIAVAPDARYYYNLCAALEKLGQSEQALEACDQVFAHAPRPDLASKTGKKAAEIRQAMKPAEPTTTTTPPPTTAPAPEQLSPEEPFEPPAQNATAAPAEAKLDYRFGLGADLGLVHNSSVGLGDYARNGLAVRLHGDVLFAPRWSLGGEGYLHISSFAERSDVAVSASLTLIDLGAGGYWHRRIARNLYFTPFAGVHVTAMATGTVNGTDTYATLGVRLEASLEYLLGGGNHVIKLTPLSLNWYAPAAGQIGGFEADPIVYGFDSGGVTFAFTIGYTFRFMGTAFPGWNLE